MPTAEPPHDGAAHRIRAKSREFRIAAVGLLLAAMIGPGQLYCLQGILPQVAQGLHISPGDSQLIFLAAFAGFAVGLIPISLLSERYGRRRILLTSSTLATLICLLLVFCNDLTEIVLLRALQGALLAGVSAILMAYIGEEFEPQAVTPAMGVYAAGNALGSLLGQMLPAWIVGGTGSWRLALGGLVVLVLVVIIISAVALPRSKFFVPSNVPYVQESKLFLSHLSNPRMLVVYLLVFCFMGAIISIFNALPFRVESPPFNVSPSVYGTFFLVILFGVFTAKASGTLAARIGIRNTLLLAVVMMLAGVALLAVPVVWIIVLGAALVTGGGFAGYTCLTSLSATIAQKGRAQASALFLASSFTGSAMLGLIGSRVLTDAGWDGLLVYIGVLMVLGFLLALTVRDTTPADAHTKVGSHD
ncbi:MFS transporter [Mycobacteroides immunogenum]|uniref:MFS transporter n=1 Tax=Mycobacteroides immunogenum TaxID=83262 RepID=UPI0025B7732C|nr:MFS transporter [Mycobacteroides immunogenum]WJR36286.1 MFS transporter [Mycobacteroides immunogenum]